MLEELTRRRARKAAGETLAALPRLREVYVDREIPRGVRGVSGDKPLPRTLDGTLLDTSMDLRQQFFEWLADDENPYFARSFVNRVWAVYFGIGLVDPVDDFSATNPPSHPKLLDALAERFRSSNYDIRGLERHIMMSAAYQRASNINSTNRDDRRNFARHGLRPLAAEVLLDAINKALGVTQDFGDSARPNALAIEVGTNVLEGDAGRAFKTFGRGDRKSICACDRRDASDLRQSVFLAVDRSIARKIKVGSVRQLLSSSDDQLVSELYLRFLGRMPTDAEAAFATGHLQQEETRSVAFDDLVWALVNSREFITNH